MLRKVENQIEFDQDYIPHKKSQSLKQKKKKLKVMLDYQCNSNKWTSIENQRFLDFLKGNKELLLCPHRRKEQKVFLQLSRQVKSRSADQCRSHHQKMIKHHNDLDGIINHLENRLALTDLPVEVKSENSQCEQIPITQSDKIIKMSFQTCLEIDVQQAKQQSKRDDDIWGLIDQDVWVSGSLLFSNISY